MQHADPDKELLRPQEITIRTDRVNDGKTVITGIEKEEDI